MHIADVTMFYAPQGGGVRRYIEAKREWLLGTAGCAHTLLVPKSSSAPPEADTIALPSFPLPFSNGYRVAMRRSPAARRLVALRPSLIEAGDPYTLAWAALAAGDELGVPVVAFCHSDLPRLLGNRYGPRAERLASLYCARLYRRFDLVLAPSRNMAARLRSWGVKHAIHQPLGVDVALFHPRRRDPRLRQKIGVGSSARLLVFAGRFAAEKNLDVLADAMRMLDARYVAVLVGAGKAPANLPPNVRVLPYVSGRKALATLLASCDAFVHPGDQETFGLAALEAMACGLPVIGADAAGIAELVTRDTGTLVEPCSASALADGVVETFRGELAAMGLRARSLAEQYAWPLVLDSIVGRYSALAKRVPQH
jgi:alpha-1,6-mannosyltransferase